MSIYIYRIFDPDNFTNCFESSSLTDVLHEFISLLLSNSNYYDKLKILQIKICPPNKYFPFIINSYKNVNKYNTYINVN